MKDWLIEATVLACCLLALKRFAHRWKQRLGAMSSPLITPPGYRVVFVLVVIGVLLISTVPEAAFILPTLDAVGLDIVTILAALELRHYFASVAHLLVRIPTNVPVYLRVPTQVVRRCRDVLRTNPVLWSYACMWAVIWIRALTGTMSPPARV
jgi:hypothetical protein